MSRDLRLEGLLEIFHVLVSAGHQHLRAGGRQGLGPVGVDDGMVVAVSIMARGSRGTARLGPRGGRGCSSRAVLRRPQTTLWR